MNTTYDCDLFAWSQEQSDMLKSRQFEKLDLEHLIDEVLSLGNSQRNKLESHLAIWLMHELKIMYQPEKHTRSWDLSIKNAQFQYFRCLKQNPSLKSLLPEILQDAYEMARWRALDETQLFEDDIPLECIFEIEKIQEMK